LGAVNERYRLIARLAARYPRISHFIAARFAPREYLGLHLTIGLAISALALWSFAAITENVVERQWLTRLDVTVLTWLHEHDTRAGYLAALSASAIGGPLAMSLLGIGMSILLAVRRHWLLLEGWAIALLGGELLNYLLKSLVRRDRPEYAALFELDSWSFPSGHAMGALIVYGMLVYIGILLVPDGRRWRAAMFLAAVLLILSIGISRLYLGVHFLSDVVGGYSVGTVWLAACISGLEVLRRARARRL
jgi:membrane-associated phospholipid phosphatase